MPTLPWAATDQVASPRHKRPVRLREPLPTFTANADMPPHATPSPLARALSAHRVQGQVVGDFVFHQGPGAAHGD